MKLKAPAKINWTLRVLGRRPDGFHELQSWFIPVALADTVEAKPGSAGLEISGPWADGIAADSGNLLLVAEEKWRQAGGVAPSMAWHLYKEIPAGAGLGGGSSDAATALKILQASATESLEEKALQRMAAEVGSDLPFFLSMEKASLRGGRGEMELARTDLPKRWLVLARPEFSLATAEVYAHSQAEPWAGKSPTHDFPELPEHNQLETAAARVNPQLHTFAAQLREYAPFQMTGSGSTFFWASRSQEESAKVLHQIQSRASWSTQTHIAVPTP